MTTATTTTYQNYAQYPFSQPATFGPTFASPISSGNNSISGNNANAYPPTNLLGASLPNLSPIFPTNVAAQLASPLQFGPSSANGIVNSTPNGFTVANGVNASNNSNASGNSIASYGSGSVSAYGQRQDDTDSTFDSTVEWNPASAANQQNGSVAEDAITFLVDQDAQYEAELSLQQARSQFPAWIDLHEYDPVADGPKPNSTTADIAIAAAKISVASQTSENYVPAQQLVLNNVTNEIVQETDPSLPGANQGYASAVQSAVLQGAVPPSARRVISIDKTLSDNTAQGKVYSVTLKPNETLHYITTTAGPGRAQSGVPAVLKKSPIVNPILWLQYSLASVIAAGKLDTLPDSGYPAAAAAYPGNPSGLYNAVATATTNLPIFAARAAAEYADPDNDAYVDALGYMLGSAISEMGLSPYFTRCYGAFRAVDPGFLSETQLSAFANGTQIAPGFPVQFTFIQPLVGSLTDLIQGSWFAAGLTEPLPSAPPFSATPTTPTFYAGTTQLQLPSPLQDHIQTPTTFAAALQSITPSLGTRVLPSAPQLFSQAASFEAMPSDHGFTGNAGMSTDGVVLPVFSNNNVNNNNNINSASNGSNNNNNNALVTNSASATTNALFGAAGGVTPNQLSIGPIQSRTPVFGGQSIATVPLGSSDLLPKSFFNPQAAIDGARFMSFWGQDILGMCNFQAILGGVHNDRHTGNLLYANVDPSMVLYFRILPPGASAANPPPDAQILAIPTHGKLVKLIDFGRATFDVAGWTFGSRTMREIYPQWNSRGNSNDLLRTMSAWAVTMGLASDPNSEARFGPDAQDALALMRHILACSNGQSIFDRVQQCNIAQANQVQACRDQQFNDTPYRVGSDCQNAVPANNVQFLIPRFGITVDQVPRGSIVYPVWTSGFPAGTSTPQQVQNTLEDGYLINGLKAVYPWI